MKLWERAFIESRLAVSTGKDQTNTIHVAYKYGFEVEDIAQCAHMTVGDVRRVLLGPATDRTGDD